MDKTSKIKELPFYFLCGLIFLLPIFILPYLPISAVFAKTALLYTAAIASVVLILIGFLKEEKISFPKSLALASAGLLLVVYLFASIFSGSFKTSFFGYGFESETFFGITVLVLVLFAAISSFKRQDQMMYGYLAVILSFVIAAVYQLVRIFAPADFAIFGQATSATANLVGKWSDFGALAGLSLILSLATLELLKLSRGAKVFLYIASALSLFFLALVNFTAVWIVIGLVALLFFIYGISVGYKHNEEKAGKKFSATLFGVILISLLFIVGGNSIGNFLSTKLGTNNIEARPSWQSTFSVSKSTFLEEPVLGVGPNRFNTAWLTHKPQAVNSSIFWDTDFSYGVGFIPSTLVTVGALGFLVWIVMFGLFSYEGYKSVFLAGQAKNWNFFLLTSFVSTLYLWILALVYPPNMVILSLAFIFSGILLAGSVASETLKSVVIDFSKNPKIGFISTFSVVVICALILTFGYFQAENVVAEVQLERGADAVSQGKLSEGQAAIASAANLTGKDFYFRSLAETEILKMRALFNTQGLSEDAARSEFQNILSAAINYASQAINYDPTNYSNWLALGGVYEAIVPLKIDGAYEEALAAYKEALFRNPQNPAIRLLMARLEATAGNTDKAKEEIGKSLALKNNYTEAIFLLSQIEVGEGKLSDAIKSVEAAALISPNDPVVFFQLGLLRYNAKDYAGAASSLERAVVLNSFYSNAKYFLGLSYDKLGRRSDARKQFEDIAALNPDNAEIKLILSNIKAGRALFADAVPPIDDTPEDREELPIDE